MPGWEPSGSESVVVALTALEVERRALFARLTGVTVVRHPAGTLFEVGRIAGAPLRIALATVGAGNQRAGILAERAISYFHPGAVLFVGIAGALANDLQLGDVVVATRVYAYQGGREDSAGFAAHPQSWPAPHHLEQLARLVARSERWAGVVHFRPIAAGDVVLNSRESPLAKQIGTHYADAAAIEMESAGVANAGHLNGAVPVLTIRAISDKADGTKDMTDSAGWQRTTAEHAAEFAVALCARLAADHPRPSTGSNRPAPAEIGPAPDPVRPPAPPAGTPPSTTESSPGPATPAGPPGSRRRRWMLVLGAGVVAISVLVVVLVYTLGSDGNGSPQGGGSPVAGSFTARSPWRLAIRENLHGSNAPGCDVTVKNTDTGQQKEVKELYGTRSYQVQQTGSFTWTANDPGCLVVVRPGPGKVVLPFAQDGGADTDAFETHGKVAVEVTECHGSSDTIELRDVTDGRLLDFADFGAKPKGRFLLDPYGSTRVYLSDLLYCAIRVSAA